MSPSRSVPAPVSGFAAPRGAIYVATGERHLAEAVISLAQLRRSNPALPVALVTDAAQPPGNWDVVLPLPDPVHGLQDKLHLRRAPWAQAVFLDTDTHVVGDLGDVFALLDGGFDLAAHQLFEGHDYQLPDVPDSFPEFNTGVIAFRNTPAVHAFFDQWTEIYASRPPPYPTDQYSFRIAVFHSGLRHTVLTPEYNFRPLATNFAITDLRIVHGRPLSALPALKEQIDVRCVHRAYVPRLGCVVSDYMTLGQIARLWRATTVELILGATRPFRHLLRRLVGRG